MNKLKIVKAIVAIMTFLLLFGFLIAAGTIYKKINQKPQKTNVTLNEPVGSQIADYKIADKNLYLLIKGGNISDRIIIISPDGESSTIKINRE